MKTDKPLYLAIHSSSSVGTCFTPEAPEDVRLVYTRRVLETQGRNGGHSLDLQDHRGILRTEMRATRRICERVEGLHADALYDFIQDNDLARRLQLLEQALDMVEDAFGLLGSEPDHDDPESVEWFERRNAWMESFRASMSINRPSRGAL